MFDFYGIHEIASVEMLYAGPSSFNACIKVDGVEIEYNPKVENTVPSQSQPNDNIDDLSFEMVEVLEKFMPQSIENHGSSTTPTFSVKKEAFISSFGHITQGYLPLSDHFCQECRLHSNCCVSVIDPREKSFPLRFDRTDSGGLLTDGLDQLVSYYGANSDWVFYIHFLDEACFGLKLGDENGNEINYARWDEEHGLYQSPFECTITLTQSMVVGEKCIFLQVLVSCATLRQWMK